MGRHHGGPYYPCLHGDCTGKAKQQLAVQGNLEGWNSSNTSIQKKNSCTLVETKQISWSKILWNGISTPSILSSIHWDPCCIPQASDLWMSKVPNANCPPPGISWGRDGIGPWAYPEIPTEYRRYNLGCKSHQSAIMANDSSWFIQIQETCKACETVTGGSTPGYNFIIHKVTTKKIGEDFRYHQWDSLRSI